MYVCAMEMAYFWQMRVYDGIGLYLTIVVNICLDGACLSLAIAMYVC